MNNKVYLLISLVLVIAVALFLVFNNSKQGAEFYFIMETGELQENGQRVINKIGIESVDGSPIKCDAVETGKALCKIE